MDWNFSARVTKGQRQYLKKTTKQKPTDMVFDLFLKDPLSCHKSFHHYLDTFSATARCCVGFTLKTASIECVSSYFDVNVNVAVLWKIHVELKKSKTIFNVNVFANIRRGVQK